MYQPLQNPTEGSRQPTTTGKVTSWMKGNKKTAIIVPVVLVLIIVLLVGIFTHVLDGSDGSPTKSPDVVKETPTECEKSWEHFKKSCYKLGYNATWYNAETNCTTQKAHLASIINDDEKKFILDMKFNDLSYPNDESSRMWIGGMADFLGNIRRITWMDQSEFKDADNAKKFQNETCFSNLCCLKLRTNKKNDLWYLGNCTDEILPFVCKKAANKKKT